MNQFKGCKIISDETTGKTITFKVEYFEGKIEVNLPQFQKNQQYKVSFF